MSGGIVVLSIVLMVISGRSHALEVMEGSILLTENIIQKK